MQNRLSFFFALFLEKASHEDQKIVRSGYWVIGNIAFCHVIFAAVMKMLRESLDLSPLAVWRVIMPMYETSYVPMLPVKRILSRL